MINLMSGYPVTSSKAKPYYFAVIIINMRIFSSTSDNNLTLVSFNASFTFPWVPPGIEIGDNFPTARNNCSQRAICCAR